MQPGFLEFFAGIGLVHMGLRQSGWRCVYANDISSKKKEMYLYQMPEASSYFHLEDIWKTDMIVERIKEPALLATASFPCIDLSLAGHMKGLKGDHSSTFYGFLQVMQRLKDQGRMPSLLMLENVTGLITGHEGKDFKEVCLAAANLGFLLDAFVIDAKHFVPQSRPRLFIIGVLESILPSGIPKSPEAEWWSRIQNRSGLSSSRLLKAIQKISLPTSWIAFDLPILPPQRRDISSVIDLDDEQDWWKDEAVSKHLDLMSTLHRQQVERIKNSGQLKVGTIFRRIREGKTRAEVRFDGLAGCLRTANGGSAKQIVIVVNRGGVKMRWMSAIEYARLQGAANYKFCVQRNQALTGFGDAVCVPVIDWIARHTFSLIAAQFGYNMSLLRPAAFKAHQLPLTM
jgi:DNA (cytosine-5)-methyltransferase 1